MDDKEREFHKNLSYIQYVCVITLSAGLALFTLGLSEVLFSYTIQIEMARTNPSDPIFTALQSQSSYYYLGGTVIVIVGIAFVIFGALFFYSRIKKL